MANSARVDELKKKFDENPRRYFAPLANEYRKQGELAQAIALCRTHLPNQPGHISGHIVLAQALYESRELGEARQTFENALDLDPENLIALRYLGDIAREQGAPASAQVWYQRVLEADPRNEEIAQLLKEVEREASTAITELSTRPTPASALAIEDLAAPEPHTEPAAPSFGWQAATPTESLSSAPALEPADEPLPVAEFDMPSETAAFESMEEQNAPDPVEALGDLDAAPEVSVDDWFADAPAAPTGEVVAEEDAFFPSFDEASTTEPEPSAEVDLADSFGSDWSSLAGNDSPADVQSNYGESAVVSDAEAPQSAMAEETAPLGFAEVPAEIPAEAAAESAVADETSEPVEDAAVVEAEAEAGLGAPQAPAVVGGWDFLSDTEQSSEDLTAAVESLASQSDFEVGDFNDSTSLPAAHESSVEIDPSVGRTPLFSEPVQDTPPAPFVTETMAELYLQQGFNEEALAIYRQLLQQAPGDPALRARVDALESGGSAPLVTPTPTATGPNVRTFFAEFASRKPRRANMESSDGAHAIGGAASSAEGLTRPDEPSELTQLFAGRQVAAPDAVAASSLASAFSAPAQAYDANAQGPELSLGDLFRDVPAASSGAVTPTEAFSLSADSAAPEPPAGPPEDVEQFTAWLEGLKKK